MNQRASLCLIRCVGECRSRPHDFGGFGTWIGIGRAGTSLLHLFLPRLHLMTQEQGGLWAPVLTHSGPCESMTRRRTTLHESRWPDYFPGGAIR